MLPPALVGRPRAIRFGAALFVGALLIAGCDQPLTEPPANTSLQPDQPSATLINPMEPSKCGTGTETLTVEGTASNGEPLNGGHAVWYTTTGEFCYARFVNGVAETEGWEFPKELVGFVRYQAPPDILQFATAPVPELTDFANPDPAISNGPGIISKAGGGCKFRDYLGDYNTPLNDRCKFNNSKTIKAQFEASPSVVVSLNEIVGLTTGEATVFAVDPGDPPSWVTSGNYTSYAYLISADRTFEGQTELYLSNQDLATDDIRIEALVETSTGDFLWTSAVVTGETGGTLEAVPFCVICNLQEYTDEDAGNATPTLDWQSADFGFTAEPQLSSFDGQQITELQPEHMSTAVIARAIHTDPTVDESATYRQRYGSKGGEFKVELGVQDGECFVQPEDPGFPVTAFCQQVAPDTYDFTVKATLPELPTSFRIDGVEDQVNTSREDLNSAFIPIEEIDSDDLVNGQCKIDGSNAGGGSLYRIG